MTILKISKFLKGVLSNFEVILFNKAIKVQWLARRVILICNLTADEHKSSDILIGVVPLQDPILQHQIGPPTGGKRAIKRIGVKKHARFK